MRLIDADDLKKKAKMIDWLCNKQVVSVEDIDNASTVNLEKTSFMKGYNYGCDDGKRFYERPHGEWKLHGMVWYCSNCGKDCEQGGNNFCGQCGADMKGGAE